MSIKALQYKNKTKISFDKKSTNYDETYEGRYCKKMYQWVIEKLRMQPWETPEKGYGIICAIASKS